MRPFVRQHWPLLIAILVLLLSVGALLAISLRHTHGHLTYALDDAYIHMAMAKNLVKHGVWGITPDGFTSSSSSPLWTLLIAATYAVTGVNTVSPFIMTLISACLMLLVAYAVLRASGTPAVVTLLTLGSLILMTPLPALVFSGMEHALQTALTLAATFLAARILASGEPRGQGKHFLLLLSLAPLLTSVRFDASFLVLVICLGFFLRRQWQRGFLFGFLGFLPIAVYGVIAKLHGWPWLPTSVLMKSDFALGDNPKLLMWALLDRELRNLRGGMHLVTLILLVLLLDFVAKRKDGQFWNVERAMTGILVGTGILHLAFARVGWFYRYEAYLVALGILVVACRFRVLATVLEVPVTPKPRPRAEFVKAAAALLLIITLFFCTVRGTSAHRKTPQATANIFEQQYQMATFIKRFYQHSTVALNDVGAVNYFADIHCLDLLGLATPAVARLRMQGAYRREEVARLAANSGARIAIAYDDYSETRGVLPAEWVRVGQWRIQNNVINGSDTVSIYAVDPGEIGSLVAHLAEFSTQLPPDVVQSGLYLQFVHSDGSKSTR